MKKRILAILLSACMLGAVPAYAVESDADTAAAPAVTSLSAKTTAGTAGTLEANSAAVGLSLPKDEVLDYTSITFTTNEDVSLTTQSGYSTADNVLYVSGTNQLTARLKAGSTTGKVEMTATKGTGNVWTITSDGGSYSAVTLGDLASEMGTTTVSIPAGGMTANNVTSSAAVLRFNQDATQVQIVLAPADAVTHTVTYNYAGAVYTFIVPDGAKLHQPEQATMTGYTFGGWFTDSSCSTSANFDQTVTSDMTIYGQYTPEETSSSFIDAFKQKASILPISSKDDFDSFVLNAADVNADQLVLLKADVDLGNTVYNSIAGFKGSFSGYSDGTVHTLSNATFKAVSAGSDTAAGLFASISTGQVLANLKLDNITVQSATYSGTLVGMVNGGEVNAPTIQNVQVTNCTVNGRSAAGVAGYALLSNIKYCSVTSGTIKGTVNAGGILGISYAEVEDSYVTIDPTGYFFTKIGGIVGKNLDSSSVTHCWCTYEKVSGQTDSSSKGVINSLDSVPWDAEDTLFTNKGFSASIWTFDGDSTTFKPNAVLYPFEGVA